MESTGRFSGLPSDLWLMVADYLSFADLSHLVLTCKAWRKVADGRLAFAHLKRLVPRLRDADVLSCKRKLEDEATERSKERRNKWQKRLVAEVARKQASPPFCSALRDCFAASMTQCPSCDAYLCGFHAMESACCVCEKLNSCCRCDRIKSHCVRCTGPYCPEHRGASVSGGYYCRPCTEEAFPSFL